MLADTWRRVGALAGVAVNSRKGRSYDRNRSWFLGRERSHRVRVCGDPGRGRLVLGQRTQARDIDLRVVRGAARLPRARSCGFASTT